MAAKLQRRSGGRFERRLGSQNCQNMAQRYSITGAAPTARLREYIESLRAICATFQHGAGPDYRGDHYRFTHMQPLFNPGPTAPLLPQNSLPDCRLPPGTLVTSGRHGAAMAGTPGCAAPPAPAKMTDELDDE